MPQSDNQTGPSAGARFNEKVAEASKHLEQDAQELIQYLNDEVVPAIRENSTKALRIASTKLTELADYLEKQKRG
jgi:phytoene dehydrogenase-like protein